LFLKLLAAVAGVVASPGAHAGSMPWASNDYVDLYFRSYPAIAAALFNQERDLSALKP
jgi:hypothetical protein